MQASSAAAAHNDVTAALRRRNAAVQSGSPTLTKHISSWGAASVVLVAGVASICTPLYYSVLRHIHRVSEQRSKLWHVFDETAVLKTIWNGFSSACTMPAGGTEVIPPGARPHYPSQQPSRSKRRRRNHSEVSCCLKYVIFGFNVIFWLIGLSILAIGVWAWTEKDTFNNLSLLTNVALDPAFIFIWAGRFECDDIYLVLRRWIGHDLARRDLRSYS